MHLLQPATLPVSANKNRKIVPEVSVQTLQKATWVFQNIQQKYRKNILWYCCGFNIYTLIRGHNKKITNVSEEIIKSLCNCRTKNNCPVEIFFFLSNRIYQTSIIASNNITKLYIGFTKRKFKTPNKIQRAQSLFSQSE